MSESERIRKAIADIDRMLKEYPYSESERRDIEVARGHMVARLEEVEKGDTDENS